MKLLSLVTSGVLVKDPGARIWLLALMSSVFFSGTVYAQTQIREQEEYRQGNFAHLQSSDGISTGFTESLTGGFAIDTSNRAEVQFFYNAVFQSTVDVPSGWNGNLDSCMAGETTAEYKNATLRRINWYRAMAGVPADVEFDDSANHKAQQAALVMAANSRLSHSPDRTWKCFSTVAAGAASTANLALGSSGASSISQYMADWGAHNFAVGHRRWILFPQSYLMGTGDVDASRSARANSLWVIGPRTSVRPPVRDEFVAWPPPGFVPYDTVSPRWSFSYPWADFSSATVRMTENGRTISTLKEEVKTGYGENTLVWIPGSYSHSSRWQKPARDMTYEVILENVRIGGVTRTFNYTVTIFDPVPVEHNPGGSPGNSAPAVAIMGGSRIVRDTDYRLDENVRFTATASDSGGFIVNTQWLIGDRVVATGLVADIRLNPGITEVTFRATDNSGVSSDAKVQVRVEKPQSIQGWASAYNGITPSPSLYLPLNNIGIIDTESQFIYTCVAIVENQQPSNLNGVARFDIVFDIVSFDDAIIRVRNSREFNVNLQTTVAGEQPSCSGTYDTVSKMYTDIVVLENETLFLEFYMHDENALELQLQHATEVTHH